MSEQDDVVRLGRDPGNVPVRLREVFPWWFLGGAVAHFALLIALAHLSPSGSGLVLWGVLIGTTIRDRRATIRRLIAENEPVTRAAIVGPGWLDPIVTAALLSIGLGLSFLLGSLFPSDEDTHPPLLAGGVLIALGATTFVVVVLRTLWRRKRRT